MSIGWGVRGQFGHEHGAALAGALAGMAVALLSGRPDWYGRIPFFAALGAIGFAFGGGMSYMKPVGYVSSSDSMTVLYGFACLFVLGFIWAAPAGAGLSLSAYLTRDELTKLFIPICTVFAVWYGADMARPLYRTLFTGPLREFGGQAFNTITATLAVLVLAAFRRSTWGVGSKLVIHMSLGWWVGHLLLIKVLQLDMYPPRGDGWAGCLGLTLGILTFSWRTRLSGVAFASLATGLLGGAGFAIGAGIKLIGLSTGWQTNWHSVMEQWHGFFFGLAIAIVFAQLARQTPVYTDETRVRRWTEVFSVTFVLCGLTYLNIRRSPGEWVKQIPNLTPEIYGVPLVANLLPQRGLVGWLDAIFVAIAFVMVIVLTRHARRRVEFIPATWLGKGQLFYLVFMWAIVLLNFTHVLPRFEPIRLVTEWVLILNAAVYTVLLVYSSDACQIQTAAPRQQEVSYRRLIRQAVFVGLLSAALVPPACWGLKRALFGDQFAGGFYMDHIRFGPNNTNSVR